MTCEGGQWSLLSTIVERKTEYGRSGMSWRGLGVSKHSPCNCKEGVKLKLERKKIMQLLGYDETGKWLFDHQKNPQNIATVFARVASLLKSIYQIWFKCSTSVGNGSLTPTRQPQNIAKCVWAYGGSKLRIKLSNLF
jgi:hypothetical protein